MIFNHIISRCFLKNYLFTHPYIVFFDNFEDLILTLKFFLYLLTIEDKSFQIFDHIIMFLQDYHFVFL